MFEKRLVGTDLGVGLKAVVYRERQKIVV